MTRVSRAEVLRFRLHAHGLAERRPIGDLAGVAGASAVQDSPPGSALAALGCRVEGISRTLFDELVGTDKSLLQTWAMRGAPFVLPTQDAAVFTAGVLPAAQAGRVQLIYGVAPALEQVGVELDDLVELMTEEIRPVLAGRRLAIGELGRELAEAIASRLSASQAEAWRAVGPYAKDQPLGEAIVHFALRILTLQRVVCFAPREAGKAPFVLWDEWFGAPAPKVDAESARAELLRRYLRCYGPSTRAEFATWLGVRVADVDSWWDPITGELVEVDFEGRRTWAHSGDLPLLRESSEVSGVRLLPPGDPYLQQRDRETLLAKPLHRALWKPIGAPGALLVDGEIVGVWRPRKSGRALTLTIETFESLDKDHLGQLQDEAERLADLRGASKVQVDTQPMRA